MQSTTTLVYHTFSAYDEVSLTRFNSTTAALGGNTMQWDTTTLPSNTASTGVRFDHQSVIFDTVNSTITVNDYSPKSPIVITPNTAASVAGIVNTPSVAAVEQLDSSSVNANWQFQTSINSNANFIVSTFIFTCPGIPVTSVTVPQSVTNINITDLPADVRLYVTPMATTIGNSLKVPEQSFMLVFPPGASANTWTVVGFAPPAPTASNNGGSVLVSWPISQFTTAECIFQVNAYNNDTGLLITTQKTSPGATSTEFQGLSSGQRLHFTIQAPMTGFIVQESAPSNTITSAAIVIQSSLFVIAAALCVIISLSNSF